MYEGQVCKVCGRPDMVYYHLPDELWAAIVPGRYRNRVVCLSCLDSFAVEKKIDYAACLQECCFVGERETFGIHVIDVAKISK